MKEAIANAGVFNLIIIFVTILLLFFIGSLSYSKAFKVKNKIISEIEKNQCFEPGTSSCDLTSDIDEWLEEIGYRRDGGSSGFRCNDFDDDDVNVEVVEYSSNYDYCVYKYSETNSAEDIKSTYYRVVAYMYFDLPIIGDLIKIPVAGETVKFVDEINS